MNKEIIQEIKRLNKLDDYTAREELKGYGFTISIFIHQFYNTEDKKYKKAYRYMLKSLEKKYNKANKGIKKFNVIIKYKSKSSNVIFTLNNSFEERTKEEVKKRIQEQKYFNYNTNRVIKPIFNDINISEV